MNSLSSKSKEHTRSSVLFVAVFRGSKEEEKTRQNQKLVWQVYWTSIEENEDMEGGSWWLQFEFFVFFPFLFCSKTCFVLFLPLVPAMPPVNNKLKKLCRNWWILNFAGKNQTLDPPDQNNKHVADTRRKSNEQVMSFQGVMAKRNLVVPHVYSWQFQFWGLEDLVWVFSDCLSLQKNDFFVKIPKNYSQPAQCSNQVAQIYPKVCL